MSELKKLLGARISQIRKQRGFSQIKFAEALDISTNALSVIETGNGFLTAETLEKILKTLNLEPEELFSFGGIRTDEELYSDLLRQISIIKTDRTKLSALYNFLKSII